MTAPLTRSSFTKTSALLQTVLQGFFFLELLTELTRRPGEWLSQYFPVLQLQWVLWVGGGGLSQQPYLQLLTSPEVFFCMNDDRKAQFLCRNLLFLHTRPLSQESFIIFPRKGAHVHNQSAIFFFFSRK